MGKGNVGRVVKRAGLQLAIANLNFFLIRLFLLSLAASTTIPARHELWTFHIFLLILSFVNVWQYFRENAVLLSIHVAITTFAGLRICTFSAFLLIFLQSWSQLLEKRESETCRCGGLPWLSHRQLVQFQSETILTRLINL